MGLNRRLSRNDRVLEPVFEHNSENRVGVECARRALVLALLLEIGMRMGGALGLDLALRLDLEVEVRSLETL